MVDKQTEYFLKEEFWQFLKKNAHVIEKLQSDLQEQDKTCSEEKSQYKQQIINDCKEADRLFKKAWGEGWDDVEIDIDLLNRLICYSRQLVMENKGE